MNKLDRRDRRRAQKVVAAWIEDSRPDGGLVPKIAAALKREREDTGMAAMRWYLFSDRNERAKVKRAIKRGAKVSA